MNALDAKRPAEFPGARVMVLAHSLGLRYPMLATDAWKHVYAGAAAVDSGLARQPDGEN